VSQLNQQLYPGGEGTRINRKQVIEAVDAQLKRLGTDYIDLLQFHWPGIHWVKLQSGTVTISPGFSTPHTPKDRYVPLYGAPDYLPEMERTGKIEDD
jgi:aryl-alcohol dehydrogenase-like predicted oxidoreductase